jgi:hypothetical protein
MITEVCIGTFEKSASFAWLLKLGGRLLEAKLAVFYPDKIASTGSWRRDTGVLRKDLEEPG